MTRPGLKESEMIGAATAAAAEAGLREDMTITTTGQGDISEQHLPTQPKYFRLPESQYEIPGNIRSISV